MQTNDSAYWQITSVVVDLLTAARTAFSAFDKKSEDRIKVGDIESTMKKLGHNIKSGWLEKIESTIDTEGPLYTSATPSLHLLYTSIFSSCRNFIVVIYETVPCSRGKGELNFSLSEIFLPKIPNLGFKIPRFEENFGAELKLRTPVIFPGGNLQLSVGKLQL